MKKMAFTGGPLNELNGKMGISAPFRSVPVMKLIRAHAPKSKAELVELIKFHSENACSCGIKSWGTVEDFGKNLYDAQDKYWGSKRFSLKECIQWEYDLFVKQSLKGNLIEKRAARLLSEQIANVKVVQAEGYLDEELRVDLLVQGQKATLGGIQVKPSTFRMMRHEVIRFNETANQKWNYPVLYLYYDENEVFENLEEIADEIQRIEQLCI